ncbi:uncharacterized protein LOC121887765 isoform X3 [Thunnus maccoyii]|uniref:uncharacterized protein LOC121887765 isoform X3 n=1 Tax=Thunnus maccoyii TaxID=8240 RepID=UPI001C4B1AB1|nr:uncharacterized protein LOC121887765 isoform X3 [Thunnus maccoyii]
MCAGCGQDGLFTSKQELIAQFWGLKTNTEKVGKTGTSDATRSLSSASNHLHHCHISWSQGCEVNQTSGPSTMFSKDVLGSKAQRLIERGLFFEPARVAIVPVGMDVYPYEEWKETSAASVETEEASSDHMIGDFSSAFNIVQPHLLLRCLCDLSVSCSLVLCPPLFHRVCQQPFLLLAHQPPCHLV